MYTQKKRNVEYQRRGRIEAKSFAPEARGRMYTWLTVEYYPERYSVTRRMSLGSMLKLCVLS